MPRAFLIVLVFCWASVCLAEDSVSIKFPSPDGRFALRIIEPKESEIEDLKVELIEKASGNVMIDLGIVHRRHLSATVLVWSADSKRVAYGTRDNREGDTSVYFWNGSAFEEIPLPDDMPAPDLSFRKPTGRVKDYGGAVKPLRWLKSGELELSSDSMMLGRDDGASYTAVVLIRIGFDAQHRAAVKKVGKTRTEVSK